MISFSEAGVSLLRRIHCPHMEGTTASRSLPATLAVIAADIKIAHSVFALPFALLATFMAAEQVPDTFFGSFTGKLGLIVLAMIFARTVAMLANRLIDRRIDADNPRTAARALPSGQLAPATALAATLLCAAFFMTVCLAFGLFYDNWWPAILGSPVLVWISAYGFFKRFTAFCHLYLGSSLALSPIAAAIAIDPETINPISDSFQPTLWLLAGMVLCWVAGFDIIYALQDVAIDRQQGLHSVPSRLGEARATWISRLLHAVSAGALVAAWLTDDRFALLFGCGTGIVIALLIYEHATVARWGTTKIALAFFTLNGVISCVLGALGICDVIW